MIFRRALEHLDDGWREFSRRNLAKNLLGGQSMSGAVLLIEDEIAATRRIVESGREDQVSLAEAATWASDPAGAPGWLKETWAVEAVDDLTKMFEPVEAAECSRLVGIYRPQLRRLATIDSDGEIAWGGLRYRSSLLRRPVVHEVPTGYLDAYEELMSKAEPESSDFWALEEMRTVRFNHYQTDPRLYHRYVAQPVPELPEVFRDGLYGRPEIRIGQPPADPAAKLKESRRFLKGLPYLPGGVLREPEHDLSLKYVHSVSIVSGSSIRPVLFPLDRVLTGASLADWSGRGGDNSKSARAEFVPEWSQRSDGIIADYAHRPFETMSPDGWMVVIIDAAGEYWGIHEIGGAHRLAAQKLRGDRWAKVDRLVIHAPEFMPYVEFSVRDLFR